MKIDPKLVKYLQSLGLHFDFENLTENDWFMIEEILEESMGYDDEPEEEPFGGDLFF